MGDQVHLHIETYKNLISSLKELELNDVADHLERNVIGMNISNDDQQSDSISDNSDCISIDTSDDDSASARQDNFHTKLQVATEPLIINVKKSTKFRDRPEFKHIDVYPMRSNPRGLVLIIANNLYKKQVDRRPSAKHDEANLKTLFEEMGFKVITYFDLTGEEIEKKIEEFSQLPELRKVNSAFVIISSHGSGKLGHQETEILGVDYNSWAYKKVVCTKIMNYFTAENCANLSGKPKIFIFQTCRGKNEQVAVPRNRVDAAMSSKPRNEVDYVHFSDTLRNYEDMLIVYSTIPGYVSYRDEYNGSWFIQILCEVFMNYAHKVHVRELFDMIDYRLKKFRTEFGNCQTPSITSQGFDKYCFLNPGLFEEKQLNGNNNNNVNKETDVTFKCCPDRKANILVCFQCESVYHRKCARELNHVNPMGKIKTDCCSTQRKGNDNEETDNKSLSENVEELKKVLDELKEENHNLKEQIAELDTQHETIIIDEKNLKNSEQKLKSDSLLNENELLKQLMEEMKDKNQLLKEKIQWLDIKLAKKGKNQWVKKNFRRVLRKTRKKSSNVVEPTEI